MNLKIRVALDQMLLLFRKRTALIAATAATVTATSVAASPAIAAAQVARIARTIECGSAAAEPTGEAPAVRRHHCHRPLRSHRAMIHGWRGGSATASSADGKPAMSHRPQFQTPSSRSSWFLLVLDRGVTSDGALQQRPACRHWSTNRQPHSLIIQAKYGTLTATDLLIRCPCSLRKVKP